MDKDALLLFLKQRHTGRQNAVTSPVLEAQFRVSGPKVRAAINELRRGGHPICSDESGYYYAETEAELNATIRQLSSRISKIAGAKNGLVRAVGRYTDSGQTSLPL
jgi:biotin operon repressor